MVIGAGLEQRLAKNNWEIKFPALGKVGYLQQKPLWSDHSDLTEAPSSFLWRWSSGRHCPCQGFLLIKEQQPLHSWKVVRVGVVFFFIFFFATKLEFSVPPVSGNGSSSTMQTVLGVVTSMDLLTFVSSNGKK